MMENFLNLMREKATQVQKTERVPIKRNPKRPPARHIIIKMAKFKYKQRIIKATREKNEIIYKKTPIKLVADFPMETLGGERRWQRDRWERS